MGMARQAPAPSYARTYVMTGHAIERFRERVDEEFTARSDADLGNLLDERIKHNSGRQTVTDLRAGGEQSEVFRIENRDGRSYYAVVRDQHVVTVLDEYMLETNFENGSWKRDPINQPFRAALQGKKAAVPTTVLRPTREPATETPTIPSIPVVDPRAELAVLGAQLAAAMYDQAVAQVAQVNAALALREAEVAYQAASTVVTTTQNTIQNTIETMTNRSSK